jgi:vitamin B12 transporter
MRGTNSNHVLVLRDGVPMNDASEPNGAFNFGNTLLGDIERIEVVRGPVSAVYGTSAIGGVINLITRRAPTDRPRQRVAPPMRTFPYDLPPSLCARRTAADARMR